MQVKFSIEKRELPYKAQYIGYITPPLHIKMGYGGHTECSAMSYSILLRFVIHDLKGCPDPVIEPIFGNGISKELQEVTRTTLDLMQDYIKQCKRLKEKINLEEKILQTKVK